MNGKGQEGQGRDDGGKAVERGGGGRGVPRELRYSLAFLIIVLLVYIGVSVLEPDGAIRSLEASGRVLVQIAPVLLLVLLIMGVMNHLVDPKEVRRHVGEGSGARGWAIAIAAGILSHGPIYVWFPLLGDMREQGMRSALIVAFLYNRGIKVPLLPMMAFYFGLAFVGVLLVCMMAASVAQGVLIEALEARDRRSPAGPGPRG